jgi:hypothetical protein
MLDYARILYVCIYIHTYSCIICIYIHSCTYTYMNIYVCLRTDFGDASHIYKTNTKLTDTQKKEMYEAVSY